ncbi:MAG: DUF1127 domain-containing protein [Pseudomonadota bacterium]
MAHTATKTTIAPALSGNAFIARLRESYARWQIQQRTYAELARLTDRDLDDLDISRAQLRDIAREAGQRARV